jgi:hypothetical protein
LISVWPRWIVFAPRCAGAILSFAKTDMEAKVRAPSMATRLIPSEATRSSHQRYGRICASIRAAPDLTARLSVHPFP